MFFFESLNISLSHYLKFLQLSRYLNFLQLSRYLRISHYLNFLRISQYLIISLSHYLKFLRLTRYLKILRISHYLKFLQLSRYLNFLLISQYFKIFYIIWKEFFFKSQYLILSQFSRYSRDFRKVCILVCTALYQMLACQSLHSSEQNLIEYLILSQISYLKISHFNSNFEIFSSF